MNRAHDLLQGVARTTVLGAVILSPWLFGSAEPWAYLLVSYLVGVGVTAWLLSLLCAEQVKVRAPLLTLVLVALVAFAAFQILPLPGSFVRKVAPLAEEAQHMQQSVFEDIGVGEFLPGSGGAAEELATVSASAAATRTSFWLVAAYVGAFLVVANTFRDWRQLRRAVAAVVVSSFLMAVFGLLQHYSESTRLYWFHKPRLGGLIFGPFTNRNHFAAHINMALGLTLGALLLAAGLRHARPGRTLRQRLARLSTREGAHMLLLGFAALLMAASVCVTLSRGAMASLAVSACVVTLLLVVGRVAPRLGRAAGVGAILVAAAACWLSGGPLVARLSTLADVVTGAVGDPRMVASADTLRLFASSPLFGCGFGSFQHVFPLFQSAGLPRGRWLHAHNDYAQLLAEGGIVGALLVAVAAIAFAWTLRSRLSKVSTATKLFVGGLGVGILAIVLHSAVDYSLHRPANALLLATVGGMAIAAVHFSSRTPATRLWAGAVRLGALAALGALVVLAVRDPAALRGELAFARFYQLERAAEQASGAAGLSVAVHRAQAEADVILGSGRATPDALCEVASACLWWARQDGVDPELRLRLGERAVQAAALAVRAAPSDYEPWLWLARSHEGIGLPRKAELCMTRASFLAPPGVRAELRAASRELQATSRKLQAASRELRASSLEPGTRNLKPGT